MLRVTKLVLLSIVSIFVMSLPFITVIAQTEGIRMGWYGPLTGPNSVGGIAAYQGVELMVEKINEKGGINGHIIKLFPYDDKVSPEEAVKAVTRLVFVDKVHCIVGSHLSGNILASATIVENAQVPEIGCGTSPVWLEQGYKYLFRSTANSGLFNIKLAEIMHERCVSKVGILHTSDEYAKVGTEKLIALFEDFGIEVLARELFNWGDTDFTGQITKIINSGINGEEGTGFVVYTNPEYVGLILKQIRQLGYDGYCYGPEGFGQPQVREVAGEAANKSIFSACYVIPESPEDAINEIEKGFLLDFISKYGKMPDDETSYRARDAVAIFEEAITNARSLKGPDIRDAIENITNFEGLAGTFNFKGNNGEGIFQARAYVIDEGKIFLYENWLKNN